MKYTKQAILQVLEVLHKQKIDYTILYTMTMINKITQQRVTKNGQIKIGLAEMISY